MIRTLALALALASFGFAPAPFLEKKKPAAPTIEGLWEVVAGEQRLPGKGGVVKGGARTTVIRIEPGRWTFYGRTAAGPGRETRYHLKTRPGPALVSIELRRNEADPKPYGKGVLKVTGDEMRLSYGWGQTMSHPTSLDPPGNGRINFTLRRVKEPMK